MSTKNEVEKLKVQLAQARAELSAACLGFFIGAGSCGYVVQWYVRSNNLNADSMLPLIGLGCAMGGMLYAMLLVGISKLRMYLRWRRGESDRLQSLISEDHFSQTRKQ